MNLTVTKTDSLRPKLTRYTASDGRGLFLDITPDGSMSWIYRYRLNGKQEQVNLGPYPDLTLKKARERRDKLAAQVVDGVSPANEKRKLRLQSSETAPTVKQFGESYFREQVAKSWKDPDSVRRYLEKGLYPALGEKLLRDVTVHDIQSLVYRKRDGGHPAAAIQLRNTIKRMYDYAVELQLVPVNPATMVANRYIGKASYPSTMRRSRLSSPTPRTRPSNRYKASEARQSRTAF